MFEESDTAARSLVDRITGSSRASNQATARMLVAIGDLYRLRLREVGDRAYAASDTFDTVTAEVSAALTITRGLAKSHLRYALDLQERLPQVGAVLVAGDIDYFTFQTIVTRTLLITDREILQLVDGQVAACIRRWTKLSRKKIAAQVDRIISRMDADAVRRRKEAANDREVWISDRKDGTSQLGGQLSTPIAHAFDQRLDELAKTVCEHDPRTPNQRRADAVEAMSAGADRMSCRCDRPDCTAGGRTAGSGVIHMIADQATVEGRGTNEGSLIDGDGVLPPEVIAEQAKSSKIRPLHIPANDPPEPHYAPSRALADFVRCRDLTCRFPGCDQPAISTDIDHTVPWPYGPTQASNLKCLCRTCHLIKTFGGWKDQQLPDGTVVWVSPTGDTFVTLPGSALLFPQLCAPTARSKPRKMTDGSGGDRLAKMPQRRRTRAQNRAAAITRERAQNRAARKRTPEDAYAVLTGSGSQAPDDDPPPF